MPLRPWKSKQQVQKVSFSRGKNKKLVKIGSGTNARVYAGRIKFEGSKARRVAIKVFRIPLTAKEAEHKEGEKKEVEVIEAENIEGTADEDCETEVAVAAQPVLADFILTYTSHTEK